MAERSRWAPGAATLAPAARAVSAVAFDGRSSEEALEPYEAMPERAAIRAITLGSLRWFLRLAPAIDALLSRPQGVTRTVRALLLVAGHQIEYSRNAPAAIVHAAVDASRILGEGRASSLVNAVLRRFARERQELLGRVDQSLAARTAHPLWLVELLGRIWPDHLESILAADNEHPPLVLRVDLSRRTVADYLGELAVAGVVAQPIGWAPAAVRLERPAPVSSLPGFNQGLVSVQDAGAQVAAPLLDAQPGMRVLDACAAPGGKTGHLLEQTPGLSELVAVDVDPGRVARIEANLARLGRRATVIAGDVSDPQTFWDGRPFDRILVDAPCSSTGVIRRHPDIKLLRRESDIAAFAVTQGRILASAFRLLAPGGRLVYCTCSLLPAENEAVAGQLLADEARAAPAALPGAFRRPPGALERPLGFQLLPGAPAGTDGFYYACLEKTTTGT